MRESAATAIEQELQWVVERFSTDFEPDHVFVLGDLIQHGESAAVDRRRVERVRSILDEVPAPVTYLLGNHDVEQLSRDALGDLLGQSGFSGRVEVGDTPVVYLDSTRTGVPGARGELGPEQLDAVGGLLDGSAEADRCGGTNTDPAPGGAPTSTGTARDRSGALVLVHHPVGLVDLSENVWFDEFPERALLGDRKELLVELTARLDDVRATIAGHVHDTQLVDFWGLPHLTVGPLSKERPGKPVTGTYAEVVVDDEVGIDVGIRDETVASFTLA